MSDRQGRFLYGPLLGFFMGLLFSKTSGNYHQNVDEPSPWYVAEKPPHYNDEEYSSQWHPLKDPVTTVFPEAYNYFSSVSGFGEETAAASNVNVRRRKPDNYKNTKRSNAKRRRINQNRPKRKRRTTTTTTEAYYYEDDDDYYYSEEEIRPTLKRRRSTTPAYEEYEDYSLETIVKPKRRKKPTFNSDASVERDDDVDTKLSAQRQATTTTEETTTTESVTTNSTMMTTSTTFAGYNGTNLHDNITFTYGPPTINDSNFGSVYANYGPPALSKLNYPPFWYSPFKSRNDIVKRVQDIVGEDDFLGLGDLE